MNQSIQNSQSYDYVQLQPANYAPMEQHLSNVMPIYTLSIDIETFSDEDLATAGVYRYAESNAAELLLFSYSVNDGPVQLVDIAMGETIPREILAALVDDNVEKWAYNAGFERVFLSHWLHRYYPELLQKGSYTAVSSSASDGSPMVGVSPRSLPASRANSQSSDSALGGRYIGETRIHHGSMSARIGNTPLAMHSADCDDASATDTSDIASGLLIKDGYPIQEAPGAGMCYPDAGNRCREASTPAEESGHQKYGAPHASGSNILFLKPDSWRCSMVWSAYLGLPQSLDRVAKVLALPLEKLPDGKRLIKFFCSPATSALDGPAIRQWEPGQSAAPLYRHLPQHHPEDWSRFRAYNKRDVEVEQSLRKRLAPWPVPEKLWREYALGERINDRGLQMDAPLIHHARLLDRDTRGRMLQELQTLTGLSNPNSTMQWKQWLAGKGIHTDKADRPAMEALLEDPLVPEDVKAATRKRLQYTHSSLKKYDAMDAAMCRDGSARGMFRFYGAGRTGRFSGHLIQLQNLPRTDDITFRPVASGTDTKPVPAEPVCTSLTQVICGAWAQEKRASGEGPCGRDVHTSGSADPLAYVRSLVREGDDAALASITDDVPDALSRLIRTVFVPRPGYRLFVVDFSAIEARILAHVADERWRTEVFRRGEDLYCASASRMFGVPVEKDGENAHLRRYGKVAELALGYGGSVGALQAMGAGKLLPNESALQDLVNRWRAASPCITALWKGVEQSIRRAITHGWGDPVQGLDFRFQGSLLEIRLPSGRSLCYPRARLDMGLYGPEITYETTVQGQWVRQRSYGARFVENIIQGLARDVLCDAMQRIATARPDWHIVGHVHDEIILECPPDTDMADVIRIMTQPPRWMPDLLLGAEGYVSDCYL